MYNVKKIVLDFDGTIFRLFTNYNLQNKVNEIFEILKNYNVNFNCNKDIFDAYYDIYNSQLTQSIKLNLLKKVNDIITKSEIEAIDTGIIVNGFFEFVKFTSINDIKLSIVSNNSKECIEKFLKKYNLTIPIIGRIGTHPELMKPNTYMLNQICIILNCTKDDIIFIGDNARDYQCAKNFGCKFIGLTPTQKKRNRMLEKTCNIDIVNNFFELIKIIN